MSETTQSDIDRICETIDLLMSKDRWGLLNELFDMWNHQVWKTDIDRLLSLATASLPGKSKIPNRKRFMEKCKELYPDENLWIGLD